MGRPGKGYFDAEGLDYEFREALPSSAPGGHQLGDKVGAYSDIRSRVYLQRQRCLPLDGKCRGLKRPRQALRRLLQFRPALRHIRAAGIAGVKAPADLAGAPISVGYQSGSHDSGLIQGLEQQSPKPEDIKLSFRDGLLFNRMELLVDRKVTAASPFSGPYYFVEQLGFRKDHRHHVHDRADEVQRKRLAQSAAEHFARCAWPNATLICGPNFTLTTIRRNSGALSRSDGYAALGSGRATGVRAILETDFRRVV